MILLGIDSFFFKILLFSRRLVEFSVQTKFLLVTKRLDFADGCTLILLRSSREEVIITNYQALRIQIQMDEYRKRRKGKLTRNNKSED